MVEMLEIAVRAESNAENYYRKSVELFEDKTKSDFLNEMADMEKQHKSIFSEMKEKIPADQKDSTEFDPYMESIMYLDALADSQPGEGSIASAVPLTGKESMVDIIRTAIAMEQKSILFYTGIHDMVTDENDKKNIRSVIREEKSHIVTLANKLREHLASD